LKYIISLLSILFTINISYSQSAPVASNVSAATVKNTNASIHLVASDADFDSLTYSIVSNPSNGTVSLSGDIVTYTPTTNYTGIDTFTFKASDGASDSATKTVTITVISGYKATQTQIGTDIDGEAADDYSGISVSFNEDGTTLAIGGYQNDDNGSNAGHVRVYSWNGSAWTKLGDDIDGEAASDESGGSVSLSSDGTTVAIGAYGNDDTASLAGHVRVYRWNGSAWTKLGDDIDGEAADDRSGGSVSLSSDGTTVAIGAYANDGNGSNAGHVRVYSWNGSAWTKLGNDIDGEAADDYSGISVSLSSDGTTVAIGAYGNDDTASLAGHVRVYSWNGSTWTKLGDDIDGEAAIDSSGGSVSLSSDGTTVAIGAYQNDGNGSNAGHVRVYSWNGSAWTKLGNDIDGEAAGDESGVSVSLSSDGTTVAIGAYQNDGNGSNAGHVRVYSWNGSAWTKLGDDIDGEAANDRSGYSVSLSSDGTTVAIGAWHNNGNGSNAGHVRVYNLVNDTNFPVAVDDTLTVLEDTSLTSKDVIANDTDTDGDTLSLTAVTTAGTGTVAINADGVSVDYTPAANFNGTEVITYTVSDGALTDATGTLTITVTAVNDAPVAVDDTLTVLEDASLTSKDVIANDTNVDGDTLSLTAVSTAGTGTVAINADGVSVNYTPAANFNGTEVITYTVSDGTLTDATGTLTITVTAVNDAPVAVDDTLTVLEDASLTSKDVIANDTDVDGDTLSLTAVSTAGTGTVAINSDGVSVDYTPAANFNGTEVITYTVSDGALTDATGTLTITVTAVNDAPVAVDDTLTVLEDASLTSKDVIANDTDVDGDTLSLTAVSTAGTGTVAINADGVSVEYTPAANFNGTEVITYTVSDGTLTDATGTLTITVTAVNDAPVAVDDTLTVLEDASLTSKDVIANDTDVDGDTLSLTAVSTAGTGTVAINSDGVSVDYTPAANFNGTEVITYTVSDGTLTDATGTLTITVNTNNYTINVTASSSANYTLSGTDFNGAVSGNDPNLTFYVGDQITFAVNASNHPFYIKTVAGTGTGNQASNVTNNGTESGNVVWTPTEAGTYYYQCSAHAGMVGTITIVSNSNLSGTINNDTTWALSGSPYTITGNVLVSNGVTLTIQPGVVINFSDDFKILVKGNIISSGTSESLITFNGNSSEGSNQMIIFKSTNLSNSTITYNVFNGPQKAIQLADESEGNEDSTKNSEILTVTYSDFNNAGLYTKGYSTSAELKFENSTFDDLIIKGYYPRSEPITFTNCVINNSSIDSDAYNLGISIISSTIKNSNITMGCCSANFLFNGSIVYNSNISNGMGSPVNGLFKVVNSFFVSSSINLPSSHFVSEKSIFFSKNSASDMLSIGNTEISNSSFIGYDETLSSTGIKISGRAGYNIGGNTNITYSTLLNFNSGLVFDGKNTISIANNNIFSNNLYNVKNNTSSDLILENNYWGTSTEAEIQNLLYDSNEDVDKGTIDYTPFSTALNTTAPISPPSNVTKSVSGSDVVLNWSANGESDVAGYKLYYGTPTGYSYVTVVDLGNVTTYTVTDGDIATEYAITAYDSDKDDDDDMVDGNESWFSVSNQVNVTLSSSATSISEPTNSATLTATLDNISSADVVVNLTYTGTATNATDFSGAASITISAGSLTGTTAITAIDDTDVELTETIIIDMGDVSGGAENGTQQVTINLTDNDLPSVSSITVDKTSIDENGGVAVITATISAAQSKDVTIPLTITGTSTIDTDYSTADYSDKISIPSGSISGTITFTGVQDSNKEDDETIIITPSTSPTNATSSISDAIIITILDENFAPVATAQTDVAATEQTELTITLAGTDSNDDTLTYIVSTLPTNGTLSDNGTVITADDLPKTTTNADVVYVSTSDTATSDSFYV
jgi:plastocyanin/aerobic-type carbon monoxide dehydrogenase small subunit (CoxS/CutS family)